MHLINHTEIVRAVNKVEEAIGWWRTDSEAKIMRRGRPVKVISQQLFDEFDKLTSAAAEPNDGFHEAAFPIMLALTDWAGKWIKFTDESKAGADVSPSGSPELWSAWDAVLNVRELVKFRKPEPIEQLVKRDGVPSWQVAKIYGWKDSQGSDDVTRVQEELEKPGTHYLPEKWIHPAKSAYDAEIKVRWDKRTPVAAPVALPDGRSIEAAKIAPEPLDTLIQQKISIEQIAMMKGISVQDVERRAQELNVVLQDARNVHHATPAVAIAAQLQAESDRNDSYESDQKAKSESRKAAISQRMKELRTAGKSNDEIKIAIAREFPE